MSGTIVLLAGTVTNAADDWKPAAGPLITQWGRQVNPADVLPEYPRPTLVRERWLNLNGLWEYAEATDSSDVPAGRTLTGRVLVPFPLESALSGVMKQLEHVWYRRTFEVPSEWNGQRVLLHFGAVDWDATVYVNGTAIGSHQGGYDGFSFDITEALRPQGPQELVVRVQDPSDAGEQPRGKQVREPKGIWYTPTTGIWQTVWLEPVPAAHIVALHVVPNVDESLVRLSAEVADGKDLRLSATLLADGKEVGQVTGAASDALALHVETPRLWSPDSPFLYDLRVRLLDGERSIDEVKSYCGLRSVELGADASGNQRIFLNGKYLFQLGPLDQGFWPDGLYTAPSDEALRYDVETMKRCGFNMARKHVKVEPERWYYWCDRLGLLVWQDMPSGNNRTADSHRQFEHELERLVAGRGNHPSIIMWVVFNEGWGQYDTERLTNWVKEELDPSRLVSNASGWTDCKVGDVIDLHAYPGPASPAPEPTRAAVLGEFGGLGLPVKDHTWTEKAWGYRGMGSAAELTLRYELLLAGVWKFEREAGLSAAVYTQLTDVETECNGLLTYDRAVMKLDLARLQAANAGRAPVLQQLAPAADTRDDLTWRFTLRQPPQNWFAVDFDDSGWQAGPAGFGAAGTPGANVRTAWKTPDIWLRRSLELPAKLPNEVFLWVHHDEDAQIYCNGVLAAELKEYSTAYEPVRLSAEARAALRPGENVLAVHCHQTGGGQYIDVGLIALP